MDLRVHRQDLGKTDVYTLRRIVPSERATLGLTMRVAMIGCGLIGQKLASYRRAGRWLCAAIKCENMLRIQPAWIAERNDWR